MTTEKPFTNISTLPPCIQKPFTYTLPHCIGNINMNSLKDMALVSACRSVSLTSLWSSSLTMSKMLTPMCSD